MADRERDLRTGQTVELLQTMIRNECVNDGRRESGEESRNADTLESFLEGCGADVMRFEPVEGRASLVARVQGSDPDAPSVCWMGHTDVVPVNFDAWSRDPFSGEVVDGEVWGRGAVDMLNVTASMAVAFRSLVEGGFRPAGDLVYVGVADEEAGGAHGAEWLCDHEWDAVACDYVLTELGGFELADGALTITTAEKGIGWVRLRVRGEAGHGSAPLGRDNALLKAAEVVRRLQAYRPKATILPEWVAMVEALGLPEEMTAQLTDPGAVRDLCEQLGPGLGSMAHACTHTTISPNVMHGGTKTNVIPDVVDIEVDIRTLPGEPIDASLGHLRAALGDELLESIEVTPINWRQSSSSPTDTPMWDALERCVRAEYPEARLVPMLLSGGTDCPFFRRRGAVAYGAGLFSRKVDYSEFSSRFHGHDERVDIDSLGLTTQLWMDLASQGL